jgi:restriction system protein
MALWMVRAGKRGEREDLALDKNLAVIGWEELPDLSGIKAREDLASLMAATYPDVKRNTLINWVAQLWAFRSTIVKGDHIVLPLKGRAAIAIGTFTGDYQYNPGLHPSVRHVRPVRWITKDLPRSAVDQDLLFSLGAFLTVCRIERNNAEERLLTLAKPASKTRGAHEKQLLVPDTSSASDQVAPPDLAEFSRDQIMAYVGANFPRKKMERLIGALLVAEGYKIQPAPQSADGGVDIIAGRGPLGFDPPRLCVQVKAGERPIEVTVLRELRGVLPAFNAEQGLLVSWSGWTQALEKEARKQFFKIRLWDSDDVINELLRLYDRLPPELKAEIPLQRLWVLMPSVTSADD